MAAQAPRILLLDAEEVVPGVTKVNLRGRLDATGVQSVDAIFARLADTQKYLVVDLSRVSFIASTGLRTLIAGARRIATRGGRMAFLQPDPSVESVLISSGTDQVIPVCQTLADAVCSVCQIDADDDDMPGRALAFSLDAERTKSGIARVGAWVDELCILLNLSQRTEYALRLCLEEVVTHVVAHAHPEPGVNADRIALRLIADAAQLSVTVQDRCAAYNPLLEASQGAGEVPDIMGISLLRQHARDLAWSRVGRSNRLAFTIPR
ncbi:MAG TPA: STAS domain-containing protein [Acetobacteraceae bacterium]|nr:STAS domain-containing protein [Acetobacteraceae bacterium]